MNNELDAVDRLKDELDSLRPLESQVMAQVNQKLRIDANYHSNAIEGNSLTLGETRSLILHGLTAHGKPLRDHLDIEGHDSAVKAIEDATRDSYELTEAFIRNLHQILLKEPYEMDAVTSDGRTVKRMIALGQYKTVPNNVLTSTGEIYYFVPPERVKQEMSDLIDWYRAKELQGEHPLIIAATFHYRFVRIHPFDDGNGRMARLLMNMILMKHGYTVAVLEREQRDDYITLLEKADKDEDLTEFIGYVAGACRRTLELHVRAARGESTLELADIDHEIALFKQALARRSTEAIHAGEYSRSTLRPAFEYLAEKSAQLKGVFALVNCYASVSVTTVGGEVESVFQSRSRWPEATQLSGVSDEVSAVSFVAFAHFSNLQGAQDAWMQIKVESEFSATSERWKFRVYNPNWEVDYVGVEIEEVMDRINRAIRRVMVMVTEELGRS